MPSNQDAVFGRDSRCVTHCDAPFLSHHGIEWRKREKFLSSKDLEAIQKRALAEGLPYQTLISSLLHKYASGRTIVKDASNRKVSPSRGDVGACANPDTRFQRSHQRQKNDSFKEFEGLMRLAPVFALKPWLQALVSERRARSPAGSAGNSFQRPSDRRNWTVAATPTGYQPHANGSRSMVLARRPRLAAWPRGWQAKVPRGAPSRAHRKRPSRGAPA
jgi:hypothetical protein